jgi:hypothetical protein
MQSSTTPAASKQPVPLGKPVAPMQLNAGSPDPGYAPEGSSGKLAATRSPDFKPFGADAAAGAGAMPIPVPISNEVIAPTVAPPQR